MFAASPNLPHNTIIRRLECIVQDTPGCGELCRPPLYLVCVIVLHVIVLSPLRWLATGKCPPCNVTDAIVTWVYALLIVGTVLCL